jgi:hypothetical protein
MVTIVKKLVAEKRILSSSNKKPGKDCRLAVASGTHAVCVCIIHQNVKLVTSGEKKTL